MKIDESLYDGFVLSDYLKLLIITNILAYKRECHSENYKMITNAE